MANAGRVAIVPKGDWSAAVEYKRLDAVAYNNTLYIAKKAVPAGTGTTNTEYWMKCVVGGGGAVATTEEAGIVKPDGDTITVDEDGTIHGAAVNVATTKEAGIVKAGDDINVDAAGEMGLKTDFTEQTDLAVLTGNEDRQTFFGKIAKAVSSLISHISLSATADKAGHVKLSNSSAVTDSTGLALPATEKNALLPGTLANQIDALNKSFTSSGFKRIGRVYNQDSLNADFSLYSELVCCCLINVNGAFRGVNINVVPDEFSTGEQIYYYGGAYFSGNSYTSAQIQISKQSAKLLKLAVNGTEYTSSIQLTVYGRIKI